MTGVPAASPELSAYSLTACRDAAQPSNGQPARGRGIVTVRQHSDTAKA
jgi:hypothetical protein